VDLGGLIAPAVVPTEAATREPIPSVREVSRYSPAAADAEGVDARLQAALKNVQRTPTPAAHLAAAEEYRRLGILDKAFAQLQQGAALDEHDARINDGLARIWRDWGLPGMGLSNAYRAIFAEPRAAIPRHTLGTLLYALGQRAEAEKAFQEVVSLDPSAWYAWKNLCQLATTAGRTQEAIGLCHRASEARRSR
jgi:tetratricopeptide (TPR) repeat protein